MPKIKKFEPLSVMRVAAVCYAALGVLEGVVFGLVLTFSSLSAAAEPSKTSRFLGPLFGVAAIIGFPLLFAILGAIGGGLGAVIYNLTARWVGGIEVEVE